MVDATSTASHVLPLMPTLWYCGCSFVANAGVAITGYGMALIFVTVYTVGELSAGFDYDGCSQQDQEDSQEVNLCGIKYAVFLQSLSLVGSMPMLLFAADAFRNSNPALLETLIPITLISTPLGQYCQTRISASWIKVVVGTVVVLVVLYKIVLDILAASRQRRRKEQEQQEKLTGNEICGTEANEATTLLENGSKSTAITPDNTTAGNSNSEDGYYHGFSVVKIRLWGISLGGSSGFLGGLIGMRGPPLMIFFLAFPFPKSETRAVGAIMLCLNMILRIGYYIVSDVVVAVSQNTSDHTGSHNAIDKNGGHHRWFFREEWVLYAVVIVSGTVAVFVGDWVHHKLDQHTFQRALALLLVATGIVNIWKGTSELQSGQGD